MIKESPQKDGRHLPRNIVNKQAAALGLIITIAFCSRVFKKHRHIVWYADCQISHT